MLDIIRKKLKEVRDENYTAMLANTYEASVATGRFAAASSFLEGKLTPEDAEFGVEILPPDWPQRKGWNEVIKQFKGLI